MIVFPPELQPGLYRAVIGAFNNRFDVLNITNTHSLMENGQHSGAVWSYSQVSVQQEVSQCMQVSVTGGPISGCVFRCSSFYWAFVTLWNSSPSSYSSATIVFSQDVHSQELAARLVWNTDTRHVQRERTQSLFTGTESHFAWFWNILISEAINMLLQSHQQKENRSAE